MSTPRIGTPTPPWPRRRERTVVERGEGKSVAWHVEEISCAEMPGALRPRCLVFTSDWTMRRVYFYPDDWQSLSDDALLEVARGR